MNTEGSTLFRFESLLEAGDISGLENAWVEEISQAGEGVIGEPEAFLTTADAIARRGDRERARTLLELLLPLAEKMGDQALRLGILRRVITFSPSRKDLRAAYLECFRTVHGTDPFAETCLAVAQVETALDVVKALDLYDRVRAFRPGTCVYHESGWGVGVVESFDPILRQAVVDLEGKRHHRIDLRIIADILESLPNDHFQALQKKDPGRIRAMIESDPVKLFEILLESFGNPKDLKVLKVRLVPEFLPAEGWSKWWGRAKGLLRDSGLFRVADRSPFKVERLPKAMSYEDELLRKFPAGELSERFTLARKHARDRSKFPRFWDKMTSELSLLADSAGPGSLEAASVLERIAPDAPNAVGAMIRVLQKVADPVASVLEVESPEDRRRAVEAVPLALGQGAPEILLQILARGDDPVRDLAARLLVGTSAEAKALTLISEAVRAPKVSPDLFSWACDRFIEGPGSPILEPLKAYPLPEIVGRVLDVLDHLGLMAERQGKAALKDSLTGVRGIFTSDKNRFFRDVIKSLDREEARVVYQRVLSSGGLSEPLRVGLIEIITAFHADISRQEIRPIWEEEWIYVTERGLAKKRAEFRELTEEKLPRNFLDIGRAAAFGDLSENAEYTSALEERDRLTKRAMDLKAQIDKVRIISPGMLKDGEVCLGSWVRLANPVTGQEVKYSVLGPWDGSPEDGVLSYRSPLAITLLGRKVGDEVEAQLPGGIERFKVVDLGSSFDRQIVGGGPVRV